MSEPGLSELHARYVALAGRFKAAWTFDQFLQGLRKLFPESSVTAIPTELSEVHRALRTVSEGLTGSAGEAAAAALLEAERKLQSTESTLVAQDVRVTPPLLRQFFEKVRSYDDQILAQMVRFYLAVSREEGLSGDRLDKVDFLITKLSEETDPVTGAVGLRDRARLRPILEGFWGSLDGLTADEEWIAERRGEIEAIRQELKAIHDIEAFTSSELVPRYREAKRLLGRFLFHPDLLMAVATTNLAIKNKVRTEFEPEEKKILEESQRILTNPEAQAAEAAGGADLSSLRRAYEEVERKQRADNLKVEDLAFLRREVQELRPRLLDRDPDAEGDSEGGDETDLVASYVDELVAALEATDNRTPPKEVALSRELFHLRLEAREVRAFRRLHVASEGDPELERFILEAAALRHRVAVEATEISEILDETFVTREAPIFERARKTTQLAEEYVQRFGERIEESVRDGNFGEAQQLQLLRMRLIRDFSGLWLLVYRPTN